MLGEGPYMRDTLLKWYLRIIPQALLYSLAGTSFGRTSLALMLSLFEIRVYTIAAQWMIKPNPPLMSALWILSGVRRC